MSVPLPVTVDASGPLLLTGAGGWFGLTALHVYEQAYGPEALRENVIPFASRAREIDFGSAYGPVQAFDLREILDIPYPGGLLHLAFLTRDRVQEVGLDDYVAANRGITSQVASLLRAYPTLPIITMSSGAAAVLDGRELDLEGNPYATLKQEEEALLRSEANKRMAIVFRVYAATGRFMRGAERFALGDFLLQAIRQKRLSIRSSVPVERSYVNVGTLMNLAWRLLTVPDLPGFHLIDACSHKVSFLELASLISNIEGLPEPYHCIDFEQVPSVYCGDPKVFLSMLSEHNIAPLTLAEQIEDTYKGLVDQIQNVIPIQFRDREAL